jgi:hypothetical protein
MRRRDFIAGLGAGAAWPLAARAQRPAMPVVGFVGGPADADYVRAFRKGLGETGYVEGRNVTVVIGMRRTKLIDCRRSQQVDDVVKGANPLAVVAGHPGFHVVPDVLLGALVEREGCLLRPLPIALDLRVPYGVTAELIY